MPLLNLFPNTNRLGQLGNRVLSGLGNTLTGGALLDQYNQNQYANIASGKNVPEFARQEFSPAQLEQNKIQALLKLDNPYAQKLGTELLSQATPESQAELALKRAQASYYNANAAAQATSRRGSEKPAKIYRTTGAFEGAFNRILKSNYPEIELENTDEDQLRAIRQLKAKTVENYKISGDMQEAFQNAEDELTGGAGLKNIDPWGTRNYYGFPEGAAPSTATAKVVTVPNVSDVSSDIKNKSNEAITKGIPKETLKKHLKKLGYDAKQIKEEYGL